MVSLTEEPQRRERPHAEELTAALTLAREQLEMDVAFLGEVEDGREVVRTSSGDADSFGLAQGTSVDLSATYCQHVLEGRLDGAVPDATREPLTAGLGITARARIGSYIGVPYGRATPAYTCSVASRTSRDRRSARPTCASCAGSERPCSPLSRARADAARPRG